MNKSATAVAEVSEPATGRYRAADIRHQPLPGIRLPSGLTVCDEALWMGRWVNRYWLSTGMIEPELHLRTAGRAAQSFADQRFPTRSGRPGTLGNLALGQGREVRSS